MNDLDILIQEYNELLSSQEFDRDQMDISIPGYHIDLLKIIDQVDTGCISIFDLFQRKHLYYSPKYVQLLGWDPEKAQHDVSYTNSLIHPDDLPLLFRAGIFYIQLGFSFKEAEKKRDYKAIFDYRVKGREGNFVRVIEQQIVLELDCRGNVWLAMSMLDLAPDQDLHMPFRAWIKNLRTNELFNFPDQKDAPKGLPLTRREKEILGLIATGLISKEIANKLYISVNTVNTHRQRIIEKLNVSNTYEAIRYANERGLFS
jgi:DNA-binding CsgD family transcriptional regulator/PAS domain-containing protein